MSYKIFVDASIDVDHKYLKDAEFIPMTYSLDGQEITISHACSEEEAASFYTSITGNHQLSTTQITPYQYEEHFKGQGDLLYIALSTGLSSTYTSALTAAHALSDQHIEVVDSLGASGGPGLLLMRALANREKGLSLTENAEDLREYSHHLCYWFMVENLMYLKRGGRISSTTAIAGTVLSIKPILNVRADGSLASYTNAHGAVKGMKTMASLYSHSKDESNDVILIHANAKSRALKLQQFILNENPEARIQIVPLSPILGIHTGPGLVGIMHPGNRAYKM